jgi:uncharacterized protein YbjT (DUF2867 family)
MTAENIYYVIAGASGHVGGHIAGRLLDAGQKVRVLGRNPERLHSLVNRGAQPIIASLEDTKAMQRAFHDAVVFAMIPPHFAGEDIHAYQRRIVDSMAQAMENAGVRYVVSLSSLGAELPSGTGSIAGLHYMEQTFNELDDTHVLHLRAGFFMENLLMTIPTIRSKGIITLPLRADLKLPMIATRDIGERAAQYMTEKNFTGKTTKELLGQRDISMEEATRILGAAISRPDLKYVQANYEEAEKAMLSAGMSHDMARLMIEMERSENEGRIRSLETRSAENTTPTSMEEFAKEFADVNGETWKHEVA